MITPSAPLLAALNASENAPLDLYEIYLDEGIYYFAEVDITWGGHHYLPYVESRSTIDRIDGPEFDRVSVTLSNVDLEMAQMILGSRIEGRKIVIRKIDRNVSNDSIVLFNGRMERPNKINEKSVVIEAFELLGSIQHEIPARTFSLLCPFRFKGEECGYEGEETECSKSWAACSAYSNTANFGGFRFIPHSGTFQYQQTETKRFLGIFPRKKTKTVQAAFNSVDDTPYGVGIPIILGRAQIEGLVIQHADEGERTKILAAMSVGPVHGYRFVRANQIAVADWSPHQGNRGGVGSQEIDHRFPHSYPYGYLAYLGITIPSEVTEVDPAPTVTAVVLGWLVHHFDLSGNFTEYKWSDNAALNTRALLVKPLAQGGMGIPQSEIDDVVTAQTAAYCDEIIQNPTGDQMIFVPDALRDVRLGLDYQRFRSTCVTDGDAENAGFDGPYQVYQPGINDDTLVPDLVPVRRFTCNLAIGRQGKAIDILYRKCLASFRGYITYGQHGKIQIRSEKPVPNTKLSADHSSGFATLNVESSTGFTSGNLVLIGALTLNAEVGKILSVGAGTITLTNGTEYSHSEDAVVHLIHMVFDDENIVGSVEFPLESKQQSTNRISVKYIDSAAGFEEQVAEINDYDHQEEIHKVNNEDFDGSAIDSYFQAWRIGQWKLAKCRDLGQFASFKCDIKATVLEIGDVVAVSAVECGLSAAPFRVIQVSFEPDDEVTILCQAYDLGVYDDLAPRATARVPAVFKSGVRTSPNPEIWHPNAEAPLSGDPLYSEGDKTFSQRQTFEGNDNVLTLTAIGETPVNHFLEIAPPVMTSIQFATTDGSIKGGTRYFLRLHAQQADGRLSPPSNMLAVDIPGATDTNKITLGGIVWPAGTWDRSVVIGGEDTEVMSVQAVSTLDETIELTAAFGRSSWGAPGSRVHRLRAKTKHVNHAGIIGAVVTAVDSTSITCSDVADDIDDWDGRIVSILSDRTDGSAAPWNFAVTDYDKAEGVFTLATDPAAAGVEPGDVLIICATATAADESSITDVGWSNKYAREGLTAAEDNGNLVRIMSGPGRGQIRRISDVINDGKTLVVDRPWDVIPTGATFIVEDDSWTSISESTVLDQEVPSSQMTIRTSLDVMQRKVVLQQIFTVDVNGHESSEEKSPFRMAYLYALADLDADVPPDPVWGLGVHAGHVEFSGLGFLELVNVTTISAATFGVWFVDELDPPATELSSGINDAVGSLNGEDLSFFSNGDYALIDGEIVRLVNITGNNAAAQRGRLESTATAHDGGAKIWKLNYKTFIFSFPEFFFVDGNIGSWGPLEPFPSKGIVASDCYVTNYHGNSNTVIRNLSSAIAGGRMRTLTGRQIELVVDGVLGIESNAVADTTLREASSWFTIYAQVTNSPLGANIEVALKVNGSTFTTLTIEAGDTLSNVVEAGDLNFESLPADTAITIDITQVGSTFPGERLIVRVVM